MKYTLFNRVELSKDLQEYNLKKGDIGTVLEYLEGDENQEDGYCLEIFDVLGNSIDVITVGKSDIEQLSENDIPNARHYEHSIV